MSSNELQSDLKRQRRLQCCVHLRLSAGEINEATHKRSCIDPFVLICRKVSEDSKTEPARSAFDEV